MYCIVKENAKSPGLDWKKKLKNIKDDVRISYESVMERELDAIVIPYIVHSNHVCRDNCHLHYLEDFYEKIKNAIAFADTVRRFA